MASPNSSSPNGEKQAQDSLYNPGDQAYREGLGASYNGAEKNSKSSESPDSADAVRDAEDAGGDWKNSFDGSSSKSGGGAKSMNFRTILKKRGPLGLIILLGLGGGLL